MTDITRLETGPRMSQAVVHNGTVWLAGQVGSPGGDVIKQTQDALDQVDDLLSEAGTNKSRLLSVTIWLADIADFDAMNAVWDKWITPVAAPARATCEAALATPDYRVEIICVAAV